MKNPDNHLKEIKKMNVTKAIKSRKSVRAFTRQPVSREILKMILDTARWAASGTNTQPWEVVVLTGKNKDLLCQKMAAAYHGGVKGKMEYNYYPVEWKDPFKARRIACGKALYAALSIEREDLGRRKSQWAANYRAFDAPVMILFYMDQIMKTGSYLDYGMFIQSVMLAALDHGLATCPQAALGEYPNIVKAFTGHGAEHTLICGMAMGYEDVEAAVNNYRTDRRQAEAFTTFM